MMWWVRGPRFNCNHTVWGWLTNNNREQLLRLKQNREFSRRLLGWYFIDDDDVVVVEALFQSHSLTSRESTSATRTAIGMEFLIPTEEEEEFKSSFHNSLGDTHNFNSPFLGTLFLFAPTEDKTFGENDFREFPPPRSFVVVVCLRDRYRVRGSEWERGHRENVC